MMPSPITWLTVPSYRCTASINRSRTGSRILRASSGSRSSSSSIEPLRSAKSTVTCLRSPSMARFDVRILSTRCFGVYASGEANRDAAPAAACPHCGQKFAAGGTSLPHDGQRADSRAPHRPQNLAAGGLSCRHCGHVNAAHPYCGEFFSPALRPPEAQSREMARQPSDGPEDLPKQAPRQVALGKLEGNESVLSIFATRSHHCCWRRGAHHLCERPARPLPADHVATVCARAPRWRSHLERHSNRALKHEHGAAPQLHVPTRLNTQNSEANRTLDRTRLDPYV